MLTRQMKRPCGPTRYLSCRPRRSRFVRQAPNLAYFLQLKHSRSTEGEDRDPDEAPSPSPRIECNA